MLTDIYLSKKDIELQREGVFFDVTVHTGRPLHLFCDRESEPQVDKATGYRLYKTTISLLKNTS